MSTNLVISAVREKDLIGILDRLQKIFSPDSFIILSPKSYNLSNDSVTTIRYLRDFYSADYLPQQLEQETFETVVIVYNKDFGNYLNVYEMAARVSCKKIECFDIDTGKRKKVDKSNYRIYKVKRTLHRMVRKRFPFLNVLFSGSGGAENRRNYMFTEWSAKLRLSRSLGFPSSYVIEITNFCDQNCPVCETGLGLLTRPRGFMDIEKFRGLIDEISPYARMISLYWMGESMLHKNIYQMIRYAKTKAPNCKINMAVNGNILDAKKMVESGLDYVEFKFSGLDQETHNAYRAGGRFEVVVKNIKTLIAVRQEMKSSTPRIGAGFLVMKHNEHQAGKFKDFIKPFSLDRAFLTKSSVRTIAQGKEMLPQNKEYWSYDYDAFQAGKLIPLGQPGKGDTCELSYGMAAITWDGNLTSCCLFLDNQFPFGNVFDTSVKEVWNSKEARKFRKLMKSDDKHQICRSRCQGYYKFFSSHPFKTTNDVLEPRLEGSEG
jgi:radical SAM protein with 4Fe4S-binding SPASM domain